MRMYVICAVYITITTNNYSITQSEVNAATISDKTVETVTQIHLHFDTPLLTPPFPLPSLLSQCCWVLSYVLQYISDQDSATLSLGGEERAAFKLNVWISGWSTKNAAVSQQVLSEIVGRGLRFCCNDRTVEVIKLFIIWLTERFYRRKNWFA